MADGAGLLDIVADHQAALTMVLSEAWTPEETLGWLKASEEILAESLGAFEMAHRGFQEANDSLLRMNEDLARQVTERLRAEEVARRAEEDAQRANMAKSEFLSRMSHELRTPLNAVLGFGQLLEMDSLDEEQRESVEQILKAGRHLLELINEVLDISRIETGQMALSVEPVQVDEAVGEAVALIRPLADEHGVKLTMEVHDVGYFLADRQRVKQVLLNLLSNGVKYNRSGGTVSVRCVYGRADEVRIEVGDDGPGIAPEDLSRLFLPFERLGAEATDVEGTGLGLAVSKRLAEAMAGDLDVDSVVGAGSVFGLRLPLAREPEVQLHAIEENASIGSESRTELRNLLYIEDNAPNLRLVERVLGRKEGYRLRWATEGILGLELAREHLPDLILLDVNLPDMSGTEVLRQLSSDARTKGIPVVVISADATRERGRQLLALGASAYLTKPIDIRRLIQVIDEALQGPGRDRPG
jgi:signal transduction histidine kinase/ActR/RegA family two-component response regulator